MSEKGKGARETVVAEKVAALNAAAVAGDGNPNLYTEGGGGKNLEFKALSGGGFEIVYDSNGIGRSAMDIANNPFANKPNPKD